MQAKSFSCPEPAEGVSGGDSKQDLLGSLQVKGTIWGQLVYFRSNSKRWALEVFIFYTLLQKSKEGTGSLFFPLYFSIVYSFPLHPH